VVWSKFAAFSSPRTPFPANFLLADNSRVEPLRYTAALQRTYAVSLVPGPVECRTQFGTRRFSSSSQLSTTGIQRRRGHHLRSSTSGSRSLWR